MTLLDVMDALARPRSQDGLFTARPVDGYNGVRIGIDASGCPGIFFETRAAGGPRRPFVLASVTYEPIVACKFDGDDADHRCAVLRCTATERDSKELFLRVVESWLPTTPQSGIGAEVDEAVARLVDLFDALGKPARGEVLGLWGELFVILAADDPRELVRAWRCDPFELHDFVATSMRLEVKTAVGVRRHQFSLEQLQPPAGMALIIASVVTKPSARGETVADLCRRLTTQLDDPQLSFRIEQTIAQTLGDRWAETTSHRYACEQAADSLAFYDAALVPRVGPYIPPEVSQVRFAVELDTLPQTSADAFPGLGARSGLERYSAARSSSD